MTFMSNSETFLANAPLQPIKQSLSLGGSDLFSTISGQLNAIYPPPPSSESPQPQPPVFEPLEGGKDLRLFNMAVGLKIAVSEISMHLPAEWRRTLFAKIDALHEPDDWEDADRPADLASFSTFLRTILQQGPVKKMSLGISPEGHILAGWKRGQDTLSLAFLARDKIRWSVVQRISDSIESAAGTTALDRLPIVLAPYSPEIWFGDADNLPTA